MNNIRKEIRPRGTTSTEVQFQPNNRAVTWSVYKPNYEQLIRTKMFREVETAMNDTIINRERHLRKYITCNVTLQGNNGIFAGLKIFFILIEEGQTIADFWFGKTIDPSSFKTMVNMFENKMQTEHHTGNIEITASPHAKTTIAAIRTVFTFA